MWRTGSRGFTLIEVMLTTVILSLAVVFIYEALFVSLDGFNYYTSYLRAAAWMNEKIWTSQEYLKRYGPQVQMPTSGELVTGNRRYEWSLSYPPIDASGGLYKIDLVFMWKQGKKDYRITRTAFARYEE